MTNDHAIAIGQGQIDVVPSHFVIADPHMTRRGCVFVNGDCSDVITTSAVVRPDRNVTFPGPELVLVHCEFGVSVTSS